jgi:hypothetical protein
MAMSELAVVVFAQQLQINKYQVLYQSSKFMISYFKAYSY